MEKKYKILLISIGVLFSIIFTLVLIASEDIIVSIFISALMSGFLSFPFVIFVFSKPGPVSLLRPTNRIDKTPYYNRAMVLAAAVIRTDNKMLAVEEDAVEQFLKKEYAHSALVNRFIERIRTHLMRETINYKKPAQQLANMPHRERILILSMLFKVSASDLEYSANEDNILFEIAGYLKISKANFLKIRAMIVSDEINEKVQQEKAREHEKEQQQQAYQRQQQQHQQAQNTNLAYQILGLSPNATNAEIKKAYRKMVKQHHPDKVAYLGEPAKSEANAMFLKIQQAYETIEKERNL